MTTRRVSLGTGSVILRSLNVSPGLPPGWLTSTSAILGGSNSSALGTVAVQLPSIASVAWLFNVVCFMHFLVLSNPGTVMTHRPRTGMPLDGAPRTASEHRRQYPTRAGRSRTSGRCFADSGVTPHLRTVGTAGLTTAGSGTADGRVHDGAGVSGVAWMSSAGDARSHGAPAAGAVLRSAARPRPWSPGSEPPRPRTSRWRREKPRHLTAGAAFGNRGACPGGVSTALSSRGP